MSEIILNTSSCESNENVKVEFNLFSQFEGIDFFEANNICKSQVNGSIASIRNIEEFNIISELVNNSAVGVFFIGVINRDFDVQVTEERSNPESYTYFDNFTDTSFFSNKSTLPWASFLFPEPSGNGGCVGWVVTSNFVENNRWDDFGCGAIVPFLCRTECEVKVVENNIDTGIVQIKLFALVGAVVSLFVLIISLISLLKLKKKVKKIQEDLMLLKS